MMAILNTNAKGDGTVRFTDSRYMNDRSELLYFIKRLLEFLNNDEDAFPFCHKPESGSLTPQIPERRLQPYFFGQIQIPYFS